MLNWGMKNAEELDVECYVEATDAGRKLYQKFGFTTLMKVLVDAENGSKERHEMIQKFNSSAHSVLGYVETKGRDSGRWDT